MQSGLADELWKLEDLFDEVTRAAKLRKNVAAYNRLAKRISEPVLTDVFWPIEWKRPDDPPTIKSMP